MHFATVKPFAPPYLVLAVLLLGGCGQPGPVPAGASSSFGVNSTADGVDALPGDGECRTAEGTCTLRAALQEGQALGGPTTLELPAGLYVLTLPGGLDVQGTVRLLGAGAASTLIDGNGTLSNARIFQVHGGDLEVQDVTLRNGGSARVSAGGGLLLDTGSVSLTRVVMMGNEAFSAGGAIAVSAGRLFITDSTLDFNTATSRGGALYAEPEAIVHITRSTISNNQSTLGGGLHNFGTLRLVNSTVTGNAGRAGTGGIINAGTMDLNNVTLTNNTSGEPSAGRAGGLASNGGVLHLRNTLIAGNRNPGGSPDCAGPIDSQGYNLIQDPTGCALSGTTIGNQLGVNPRLGLLIQNGGPTRTHALLADSPALEAGSPAPPGDDGAFACVTDDQRGVTRLQGARCDIGAFER